MLRRIMERVSYVHIGIFLTLVLLFVILLFSIFPNKVFAPLAPSILSPKRSVYIGLWTDGFFNNTTHSIDPVPLQAMEQKIGKKVAIAHYFRGWEFLDQEEILTELQTISRNSWRPMVSANPYFFSECQANGMKLYQAIAAGNCDEFLHKVGQTLKQVNKPFFLRFAWEMNVASMQWSTTYTRDTPQDFIAAWRHFHDIVQEEGAKNVLWVFSPQIETPTTTDIAKLYPGDNYVDWVGLDGYNWGTTQSWSRWQDFYSLYYPSYVKFLSIAPKKPLMIAEVNTSYVGGNQADWYTDMLSWQIPENFPKVDAIVFFNEDKFATERVKWLIDSTPNALKAFQQAIKNPIYTSHF